jgi:TolA-binding protein
MFITSMGIFGFLSKAHLEQTQPVGNNSAKIERLEQMIAREQREINDAEKVIEQLDQAVAILQEYDRIRGPEGALAVRKSQTDERAQLRDIIDQAQATIDGYEDTKLSLEAEVRELELEVGPIRYVAELVYEDAQSNLESAVRWVIIILVVVFDPLAVLLLIAANASLAQLRETKPLENTAQEESAEADEVPETPDEDLRENSISITDTASVRAEDKIKNNIDTDT